MTGKLDKCFVLFSCCLITKGVNRSIIIDTQRNEFHFIPNELCELIEEFRAEPVRQVMSRFTDAGERDILLEYLNFFEQNELGFYTNNPDSFPRIDNEFRSLNAISNAIIDIRNVVNYDIDAKLQELESLGCEAVQIRIFESLAHQAFDKLLQSFAGLSFRCVEILMNADELYDKKHLRKLLKAHPDINKIVLHSSKKNGFLSLNHYQLLEFKTSVLANRTQCGQIGAKYFIPNLSHVIESQSFNVCLNKKIAIDEDGFIKNCPSFDQHFGNARESSLTEAMERKGFKDFWALGKDKIETCKDCEFRHICTDCRAYIKEQGNLYSKPAKCGYDPYTNIWQDWSLNALRK